MSKTFIITYDHITGPKQTTCNSLRELSQEIERIEEDSCIVDSTVSINTIEPKVEQPVINVASDPIEEAKVKEMLRFAGKNY